MIYQQFPDLHWLKQRIADRFRGPAHAGAAALETTGFPSVIIHTKANEAYRPDILGPISLFMNLRGASACSVDGRRTHIPPDYFFLSNRLQEYTLEIESRQPVETFNIHIGEAFSEGVLSALLTPADTILNNGLQQQVVTIGFHNQLYRKDETVLRMVQQLLLLEQEKDFSRLRFEEILADLLAYLLSQHRGLLERMQRIPAIKQSTRVELFRRLSFATDCLHATSTAANISLDTLAAASCLSKYHFLRLFRQVYGVSPYQFWQLLRLQKAESLLRSTRLPIQNIAEELGFENSNSFSRLFRQRYQVYPAQYRLQIN